MSVSWHFYGTTWNDPTIGDFLGFLRSIGIRLRAKMPTVSSLQADADDGVDLAAPLVGQGLYLVDDGHTDGALAMATQPIDRQHRQLWASMARPDAPSARELSTVAALTAYDAPASGHYGSLTQPVLVALGELFPPGYGVDTAAGSMVSTAAMRDRWVRPTAEVASIAPAPARSAPLQAQPVQQIQALPAEPRGDTFGIWGRYLIGRQHRSAVRAIVQGTPVLSHIATLLGDALTIDGRGVTLTRDEWFGLQAALVECAARAHGGFVEVRCRGSFDTRIPARGHGGAPTAPAAMTAAAVQAKAS